MQSILQPQGIFGERLEQITWTAQLQTVKDRFQMCLREISEVYETEIQCLNSKISSMKKELSNAKRNQSSLRDSQLESRLQETMQNYSKEKEKNGILEKQLAIERIKAENRMKDISLLEEKQRESQKLIRGLREKIEEREAELAYQIHRAREPMNLSGISNIMAQGEQPSLDMSMVQALRQSQPVIRKFVEEFYGQQPKEEAERGSLQFLLLSKDNESGEKYCNVNRRFFQQKFKENEKKLKMLIVLPMPK